MNLESYELVYQDDVTDFSFISQGKRGTFRKLIQFQKLNNANFFNLAFGDEDFVTKGINDVAITDNGDTEKVLATVANAVYLFTNEYQQALIYIEGSTQSRTRLYQMGINRFYELLKKDFDIYGEFESEWVIYKKGIRYNALLVHRKTRIFEL